MKMKMKSYFSIPGEQLDQQQRRFQMRWTAVVFEAVVTGDFIVVDIVVVIVSFMAIAFHSRSDLINA